MQADILNRDALSRSFRARCECSGKVAILQPPRVQALSPRIVRALQASRAVVLQPVRPFMGTCIMYMEVNGRSLARLHAGYKGIGLPCAEKKSSYIRMKASCKEG